MGTHRLSLNQQLEAGVVFLENCATFLSTVGDKTPEADLKSTFQEIAVEVESRRRRLSDYQRRRQAQVRADRESKVSADRWELWDALRRLPIFQKPGIGKSLANRVVSRTEAQEKATHYCLLGIIYFELCREATVERLRKLAEGGKMTMILCATKSIGKAAISRQEP